MPYIDIEETPTASGAPVIHADNTGQGSFFSNLAQGASSFLNNIPSGSGTFNPDSSTINITGLNALAPQPVLTMGAAGALSAAGAAIAPIKTVADNLKNPLGYLNDQFGNPIPQDVLDQLTAAGKRPNLNPSYPNSNFTNPAQTAITNMGITGGTLILAGSAIVIYLILKRKKLI